VSSVFEVLHVVLQAEWQLCICICLQPEHQPVPDYTRPSSEGVFDALLQLEAESFLQVCVLYGDWQLLYSKYQTTVVAHACFKQGTSRQYSELIRLGF
jgi:hypothetical protein